MLDPRSQTPFVIASGVSSIRSRRSKPRNCGIPMARSACCACTSPPIRRTSRCNLEPSSFAKAQEIPTLRTPGRAAPGVRGQRICEARQIRSRQQLLDLAARGARAERRVQVLLDPTSPLALTNRQLALSPPGTTWRSGEAYVTERGATVFVRLAPLTLPARFRSWVTTTAAAAAVVGAAEELSVQRGLTTGWATPHPDGVSLQMALWAFHSDALQMKLHADARLTLDAAGVAGAALSLAPPAERGLRPSVNMNELADRYIAPVVQAAGSMLVAGEFLGRARCQIDLWGPAVTLALSESSRDGADWTARAADVALPYDPAQIQALARQASYAYGRSAGVPAWDPPVGE